MIFMQGTLTYEGVTAMSYLDNVVSESLRLYPPSVQYVPFIILNFRTYVPDAIVSSGSFTCCENNLLEYEEESDGGMGRVKKRFV